MMVPDQIEGYKIAHLTEYLQIKGRRSRVKASFSRFWHPDMTRVVRTDLVACKQLEKTKWSFRMKEPREKIMISFLVADTRLCTMPCQSVGWSVCRSVTFLNSERVSPYRSYSTVCDWIAVYPALFSFGLRQLNPLRATTLLVAPESLSDRMTTRPDARPIPVADGWAGAEMRVFTFSNSITMTDRRTDERTDRRTDGRTKPLIELRVRN